MGPGNVAPTVGSGSGPLTGVDDRSNGSIGNQTFQFADAGGAAHGGSFISGAAGASGDTASGGGSGESNAQAIAAGDDIVTSSMAPDRSAIDGIWRRTTEASEAQVREANNDDSLSMAGGKVSSLQSAIGSDAPMPQHWSTNPAVLSRFLAILLLIAFVAVYRFQRQRRQQNDDALAYRHRFYG